jgi:RNA polymerase sigma factor (sigma-70 family)
MRVSGQYMNSNDHFAELVIDNYEPLFRFAMTLVRNEADASDLTQQAFYVWANKGHQLRDATKAKTWLFTTLYRSFLVGRRSASRYDNNEFETISAELPADTHDASRFVDGVQALAALARVDDLFQAPLALFYLEDISYAEIAERLELPIGTVKSRIARGIGQLRKILIFSDIESPHNSTRLADDERDLSISLAREQLAVI